MPYDPSVIRKIKRIGRRRGMGGEAILGALATGIVESGLTNIQGGDADSSGWRQERASLYPNPNNLRASVNRFYNEWQQHDRPGFDPGTTAANVQRPAAQYRGRYAEVLDEARKLMGRNVARQVGAPSVGSPSVSPPSNNQNLFATLAALNAPTAASQPNNALQQQLQAGWNMLAAMGQEQQPQQSVSVPNVERFTNSGGKLRGNRSSRDIDELFYDPQGGWDKGTSIGPIGGHDTHAHVGTTNAALLRKLAKKADRKFGLSVREYSPYDKVDPVHTEGSMHYSDDAFDTSGARLADYVKWLRRKFNLQ